MPSRSVTHTEDRWMLMPAHILRCTATYKSTGEQCRREAYPGATICTQHGGAAPQVQAAAQVVIAYSVEQAAQHLVDFMSDPNVDTRDRLKAATELLDRAGLSTVSKHLIGVTEVDPVESLFRDLAADQDRYFAQPEPLALEAPKPDPAQEAVDRLEESHQPDAEVIELKPSSFGKVGPHQMSPPKHIREGLERNR